jgi:hypothetical protein
MERVLGPAIDPPHIQGGTRPCGVYRYPDLRVGCQGRVMLEIWGEHGECLFFGSVAGRSAHARTEVAAWAWLEDEIDERKAVVNAPMSARLQTPPRLGIVR